MGNRLQRVALAVFLLLVFTGCATPLDMTETQAEIQSEGDILVQKEEAKNPPVYIWPLKTHRRASREFGRGHEGIDLPAPTGTSIYTMAPGRVVYSGHVFKGYGNMVLIEHARGLATIYGHCSKIFVRSGQFVGKNSIIGLVGKTGRASAPHLHFEVRLNKKPVNPRGYLPR